MTKIRVFAIIDLALILVSFGILVAALFIGNYNLFFMAGGLLVALLIAGFILKQVQVKARAKEDSKEE